MARGLIPGIRVYCVMKFNRAGLYLGGLYSHSLFLLYKMRG